MLFKCQHPADRLLVARESTREKIDDEWEKVNYHFICMKCNDPVTVSYSNIHIGVDKFLDRATVRMTQPNDRRKR